MKLIVKTIFSGSVVMALCAHLYADYRYDPLDPYPTQNDIWAAEQNAIIHGQNAATAMSDHDTWRSIEEHQKASRARQDATDMQNRIMLNERQHRQHQDASAYREDAGRGRNIVVVVDQDAQNGQLSQDELFNAQVRALQPTPYTGGINSPGYCFMCGAHLLGRQQRCEKCKRHPPWKYTEWKNREKAKAIELKRLLSGHE